MLDPNRRPVLAVSFRCADGSVIERSWTMGQHAEMPDLADIPEWLENPSKDWPHPQDPVTYRGDVRPGSEAAALALVGRQDSDPQGSESGQ